MITLKLKNTDLFAGANVVMFLLMWVSVYFNRFAGAKTVGNIPEFSFYAVVILLWIATAATLLRRFTWPLWILALVQIGILAHFAGGFVPVNGGRLYDAAIYGLRYDKIVHFYNSFAGTAATAHVLSRTNSRLPLRSIAIVLISLGTGAVIEIVEYFIYLHVPRNGVGDYDNNMQDLVANLFGGIAFVIAAAAVRLARGRDQSGVQEAVGHQGGPAGDRAQ
jgi:uncharacterized membrane protein YjdF